jgi:hypothetical protein
MAGRSRAATAANSRVTAAAGSVVMEKTTPHERSL